MSWHSWPHGSEIQNLSPWTNWTGMPVHPMRTLPHWACKVTCPFCSLSASHGSTHSACLFTPCQHSHTGPAKLPARSVPHQHLAAVQCFFKADLLRTTRKRSFLWEWMEVWAQALGCWRRHWQCNGVSRSHASGKKRGSGMLGFEKIVWYHEILGMINRVSWLIDTCKYV